MTKRPNILFVFPDQLRPDWLGTRRKEPVRTPNIDRLAARGVDFTRAWTPSPVCSPARACFAACVEYDRSPVKNNKDDFPLDRETIYSRLERAGYRVATTGKLDLLKDSMDWGADGQHVVDGRSRLAALGFTDGIDSAGKHDAVRAWERRLQEPYFNFLRSRGLDAVHGEDFLTREPLDLKCSVAEAIAAAPPPPASYANVSPTPLPDDAYCDNWVGRNTLSVLDGLIESGAPWCLSVNFAGPHEPMDVTESMREAWDGVKFSDPHGRPASDAALQQQIRRRYAAMIELIDSWLGRMVQLLDEKGVLDDTLVVFASDHGEMLGDCNLWGKQVPHEQSIGVPLICAGPMVRNGGRTCSAPVSLIDLAATFLDIAGAPAMGDGVSLVPILAGERDSTRPYAYSGLGAWRAITDGRFKLVAGFNRTLVQGRLQLATFDGTYAAATIELYDMAADPWEETDISATHPEVVAELWQMLATTFPAR